MDNYDHITVLSSGTKIFWKNKKIHRTDGPAIESMTKKHTFYIDGEKLKFIDWVKKSNLSKEELFEIMMNYYE